LKIYRLLTGLVLVFSFVFLNNNASSYTFTSIDVDVPSAYPGTTQAYGINGSGNIVGAYQDNTGIHGFLYEGGSFTPIDISGASNILASGINGSGNIVGWYQDNTGNHGFLDVGGSFTPIDVPGAIATFPRGINDAGNIVGSYTDSGGRIHGFEASPSAVPEPSTLFLLGTGLIGLAGYGRKKFFKK